jgi:hypothetical protein
MADFMDSHKVIVKSTFQPFSSARNVGELKGGAKSEELRCQFSQVKGDLNLQEMPKLISIKTKAPKNNLWYLVPMFIHCVQ